MFGSPRLPQTPPPQPVVTGTDSRVLSARRRTALRASKRRGNQASVVAGETFSGTAYGSNAGMKTLLGQ